MEKKDILAAGYAGVGYQRDAKPHDMTSETAARETRVEDTEPPLDSAAFVAAVGREIQRSIVDDGTLRTFNTGATRDTAQDKLDFEGFLSPLVMERFAKYMHEHRKQSDGTMRDSDNWQKGIPLDVYMKSMWRHFFDVWKLWRHGRTNVSCLLVEALCALMFNVQGMMHELLVKLGEMGEQR